jgi:hypothetical protein
MANETLDKRVVIVIPVFNDWEVAGLLLRNLDDVLQEQGLNAAGVLVNDGSSERIPSSFKKQNCRSFATIDVLHLWRNVGHQRAICIGLVVVNNTMPCRTVIVMDADGEDKPEDVIRLIEELDRDPEERILFAARTKRLESGLFQASYRLYRAVHWLLTGVSVRVGNFSAIPYSQLARLVSASELWNHYAACVFRARVGHRLLPTERGKRLSGRSKMNYTSLVVHGLSAISVFGEVVGVRLLLLSLALALGAGMLVIVVLAIKLFTQLAIPGWTTQVIGLLVVVLLQAVMLSFLLGFVVIGNRTTQNFLPLRDCPFFIHSLERIFTHDADA